MLFVTMTGFSSCIILTICYVLKSQLLDSVFQRQMIYKEQRAFLCSALERGLLQEGSHRSMTPTWKFAVCVTGH